MLFLSDVDEFSSKFQTYTLKKILVLGEPSCFMQTERGTDTTALTVACANFANAPENVRNVKFCAKELTRLNDRT